MSEPNPFAALWRSRKFWLLTLDAVVSLVLFFVGRYDPAHVDDVKFVIATLQPIFVVIIAAIAYEDAAAKALRR